MNIKIEGNEGKALIGTVEWIESVIEQGTIKFRDQIGLVRQMSDTGKNTESAYGHELWMDYIWEENYGYSFGCREEPKKTSAVIAEIIAERVNSTGKIIKIFRMREREEIERRMSMAFSDDAYELLEEAAGEWYDSL